MRTLSVSLLALVVLAGTARADDSPHGDHAPAKGAPAILFDNLGSHHHAVTTRSKEAQAYFDQGLRLIYGFNHDEAIRSFGQATRLDPNCAMAWWGIAYALGPNYNLPLDDERNQKAFAAMKKAAALAPKASRRERDYIAALQKRYSLDPKAERRQLDRRYADAMRALAKKYPDDLDAATLFAESLMDLRPWDLWTLDGKPQPGTEEIVVTLEDVLKKDPNHPGANHYYIHSIEASTEPERALPSAQRLATLVPGAGHLVHMPSHIYMRLGDYERATEANRKAAAVDREYIEVAKPDGVYPMMYYPHNIHFLWSAASMEGRSADAIAAATELEKQLEPGMMRQMPMLESFSPTLLFALARFGRWEQILQQPEPPADLAFAHALWVYARGLALAANGTFEEAQAQLAALHAAEEAMPADRIVGDNTPARSILQLARHDLAGEIAAHQGRTDEAVSELREAVRLQDGLPYTEPPPWYYPERQSLGQVLLDAGRPTEAVEVYREDLRRNPSNGWSLYGLARGLEAQGDKASAADITRQYEKAWGRADVKLHGSRF